MGKTKVGYGVFMASYFNLFLDTASPQLTISMPTRSIPENVIEINIKSNEKLDLYQEIYIIDSEDNRHDYIFSLIDDYNLFGYVDLQNYPFGIATLYVRVKDEVFNISELYSKNLNVGYIVEQIEGYIEIKTRNSMIDYTERTKEFSIKTRNTTLEVV
jgi:hypothetical protein